MPRYLLPATLLVGLLFPAPLRAQGMEDSFKTEFSRAVNLQNTRQYSAAEQSFLEALKDAERLGPDEPRVGTTLNALAQVYIQEKKFTEAENSLKRAMTILTVSPGDGSIEMAELNYTYGLLMFESGRAVLGLPYLQRTLATDEAVIGEASPVTAQTLCLLGDAYRVTKSYGDAERYLKRCADVREGDHGMQNPGLADALHSLALTYQAEGKLAQAEPRFTLAEKIRENTLGITSPLLAQTMEDHAAVLKAMGRDAAAARLLKMSAAIRRNKKN
jgi:tetratricopeptide (TPR) repeat protein